MNKPYLRILKKPKLIAPTFIGGLPGFGNVGKIYVAATSEQMAATLAGKVASIYEKGQIVGAAGLLLGLAKLQGVPGVCILGQTTGMMPDRQAALSVFRYLVRVLERKQIKA